MPPLNEEEQRIIERKGTEAPFSGEYETHWEKGKYICRKCGADLYKSDDKFDSRCGWPSFDDAFEGAVRRTPDPDGVRVEITCNNCDGHLGHVFEGEGFTQKNTRHCVNSVSLVFVPPSEEGIADGSTEEEEESTQTELATFASGCFWGTEYHFQKVDGVIATSVGYTGGHVDNPTYEQVCSGTTGHREAVQVEFDPARVAYSDLVKLYFETHDPEQVDGQGPDRGSQYTSAIYVHSPEQRATAEELMEVLTNKGYALATQLEEATTFYPAEEYHQSYYQKNGQSPYCHIYTKRFD